MTGRPKGFTQTRGLLGDTPEERAEIGRRTILVRAEHLLAVLATDPRDRDRVRPPRRVIFHGPRELLDVATFGGWR